MLAYLDPGSGSIIVGAIVAGFAGVAVFFRMLWRRIRHPFGGGKARPDDAEQAPEAAGAEGS